MSRCNDIFSSGVTLPYFLLGATSFVPTYFSKYNTSVIKMIAGVLQDVKKYIWSNLIDWGEGRGEG